MSRRSFCGVVAAACFVLLAAFIPRGSAADADDAKLFDGKWKVWRSEFAKGIDADSGDGMVIDGTGVQFLWGGNNKGARGKFTIDPSKDPKEIDVEYLQGSEIGKKRLGIYRITKGQVEICWAGVGETKRPKKFTGRTAPGGGEACVISRNEDFKEADAVAKEIKQLEGIWRVDPKGDGVVIDEDAMQFLNRGDNKGAKAKFLVDPTKDPKEIEIIYTQGSERYKRRVGIYKMDGDTLQLSLSDLDSDKRPTKFAGGMAAGAGKWFATFKKDK
jgi:uncharacterized protein (TIGR03067 family)